MYNEEYAPRTEAAFRTFERRTGLSCHAMPYDVFATWWLMVRMRIFTILLWHVFSMFCQPSVSVIIRLMETKSVTDVGEWLKENGVPDYVVKIFRGKLVVIFRTVQLAQLTPSNIWWYVCMCIVDAY